jgi:hypothetical protein
MATPVLVERPELQSIGLCTPRDAANDLGCEPAPHDDSVMDRLLENVNSTPWGAVLKRIARLRRIRRGKVMTIRRQIAQGTYSVEDRLDRTTDRILEDLSAAVRT